MLYGSRKTAFLLLTRWSVATVPVTVLLVPSRWFPSMRRMRNHPWFLLSTRLPALAVVPVNMSVRRVRSQLSMLRVTKCIRRFKVRKR